LENSTIKYSRRPESSSCKKADFKYGKLHSASYDRNFKTNSFVLLEGLNLELEKGALEEERTVIELLIEAFHKVPGKARREGGLGRSR